MLRTEVRDALKVAQKAQDKLSTNTLRLILAAIKDRDIAARAVGNLDGITDDDILALLQSMIKQRHESVAAYEKGNRPELAEREAAEIGVIEGFLPEQMSEDEIATAVAEAIAESGAASLKEMGQVMTALKERYTGSMDFGKASAVVKERLA